VRASSTVDVTKRIHSKLPIPIKDSGLERTFIPWADDDSTIGALAKLHEYRPDFLCRPYLNADGMSAQYSPDFLARAADDIHVVDTETQLARSENAQSKQRAATTWCEQINQFPEEQRDGREWHYVLFGETIVEEWKGKNARASELLDYARLRRNSTAPQERQL
jgi:type III restriction enzyme